MSSKRWAIAVEVVGFALLIGGLVISLVTDRSFETLWLFGFVLALSGTGMRQKAARTSERRDTRSIPPNPLHHRWVDTSQVGAHTGPTMKTSRTSPSTVLVLIR